MHSLCDNTDELRERESKGTYKHFVRFPLVVSVPIARTKPSNSLLDMLIPNEEISVNGKPLAYLHISKIYFSVVVF